MAIRCVPARSVIATHNPAGRRPGGMVGATLFQTKPAWDAIYVVAGRGI